MSDAISNSGQEENLAYSTASDDAHTILLNKVSWGAIFAGVVVALVTQVLLTMLGAGIGIATLDPGTGDNPEASTFSI
ncbi:MAG: PhnA-like protein, partial [Mesorhizobium sp.]